jgi:hypothetical protein
MKTLEDRFWEKVAIGYGGECWQWVGAMSDGYGQLLSGGKLDWAHRLSWKFHCGDVSDDICVCHRCDNRGCVNPTHLFLATNAENSADMVQKGRSAKGEQNGGGTKLRVADIPRIRESHLPAGELARMFNITRQIIWKIRKGYAWKHVS